MCGDFKILKSPSQLLSLECVYCPWQALASILTSVTIYKILHVNTTSLSLNPLFTDGSPVALTVFLAEYLSEVPAGQSVRPLPSSSIPITCYDPTVILQAAIRKLIRGDHWQRFLFSSH